MQSGLNLKVLCKNINVILNSNVIASNKKKIFFSKFKPTDPEIKKLIKTLENVISQINKNFATPALLNEVITHLKPFIDPDDGMPKAGNQVKTLLSGMYEALVTEQKLIQARMSRFDAKMANKKIPR